MKERAAAPKMFLRRFPVRGVLVALTVLSIELFLRFTHTAWHTTPSAKTADVMGIGYPSKNSSSPLYYEVQEGDTLKNILQGVGLCRLWSEDGFVEKTLRVNPALRESNGTVSPGQKILLPVQTLIRDHHFQIVEDPNSNAREVRFASSPPVSICKTALIASPTPVVDTGTSRQISQESEDSRLESFEEPKAALTLPKSRKQSFEEGTFVEFLVPINGHRDQDVRKNAANKIGGFAKGTRAVVLEDIAYPRNGDAVRVSVERSKQEPLNFWLYYNQNSPVIRAVTPAEAVKTLSSAEEEPSQERSVAEVPEDQTATQTNQTEPQVIAKEKLVPAPSPTPSTAPQPAQVPVCVTPLPQTCAPLIPPNLPKPEKDLGPEALHALEIGAGYAFTNLGVNASATQPGAKMNSSHSINLNGAWLVQWTPSSVTRFVFDVNQIDFQASTNPSKVIGNTAHWLIRVGLEGQYGSPTSFRFLYGLGAGQRLFLHGISTSQLSIDSVAVPSGFIGAKQEIFTQGHSGVGVSGLVGVAGPATTDGYSVRMGYEYSGSAYFEHRKDSGSTLKFTLGFRERNQNTSILNFHQTDIFAGITTAVPFFSQ